MFDGVIFAKAKVQRKPLPTSRDLAPLLLAPQDGTGSKASKRSKLSRIEKKSVEQSATAEEDVHHKKSKRKDGRRERSAERAEKDTSKRDGTRGRSHERTREESRDSGPGWRGSTAQLAENKDQTVHSSQAKIHIDVG